MNFRNDIASKNIYEKLNKDLHCNPNENYKLRVKLLNRWKAIWRKGQ